MGIFNAAKKSLGLLSRRDRLKLSLITLAQACTSLLDLLGVLLLGIVTAIMVAVAGSSRLPTQVSAILTQFGLNDVLLPQLAIWLAGAAAAALILKSLTNILLTRQVVRFLANRQAAVSAHLTARLFAQPLTEVTRQSSQQVLYSLTTGVNYATLIILSQLVVLVAEASLLIILGAGLLVLSPFVALASFAYFMAVAGILQRVLSGWAADVGTRSQRADVSSWAAVQEGLRSYREVTVLGRRASYVDRVGTLRMQYAEAQADGLFIAILPKYVLEVSLVVGAGLLAVSQLRNSSIAAAMSTIVIFLAAGTRIIPSILRLQSAAITIRNGAAQAEPTYDLAMRMNLDTSVASNYVGPSSSLQPTYGDKFLISLDQVSYKYPEADVPALMNISFDVKRGASVAIVGPTGAGKSTLVDLMMGLLPPCSGHVYIAGRIASEMVASSPGQVAYVPQSIAMANSSLRENVALGLVTEFIDDTRVIAALDQAKMMDVVRSMPHGLDTQIGEHGFRLSGGQRQRLGIARALYSDPKLLVLDEATSALDAETEAAITETLLSLEGVVTTVIVAHRLATVRHCDLVIYLENGRLEGSGSFDEVRVAVPNFDRQANLLGL